MSKNNFDSLCLKYLIDTNKLQRNYDLQPIIITKNGIHSEVPPKDELIYLYHTINMTLNDISLLYSVKKSNISRWIKKYNIQKTSAERSKNIIKSNMLKYGVHSASQLDNYKNKMIQTNMEKYGSKYIFQTEIFKQKTKQTKLIKYGDENYSNHKQASETFKKNYQRLNVKEKTIKTNLKKYGKEWYSQTNQHKQYICDNIKEINYKQYQSKKQNRTLGFTISNEENECLKLLKSKYPDIISQFRDENRYPFNCDFYIPSEDLFIEYQGYLGGHYLYPYRDNDEDKKILEEMKQKSLLNGKKNNIYERIVKIWGNKDCIKRKYAYDNSLNYIEFYNIDDVKKWLENN